MAVQEADLVPLVHKCVYDDVGTLESRVCSYGQNIDNCNVLWCI